MGDLDTSFVVNLLNKHFGDIPISKDIESAIAEPKSIVNTYVEQIKEDAQQAQILQGWIVPAIGSEDYPKLMLLNVILGASGLSSRLFLELREKKGLAYTVRRSYENHKKAAVFSIYIGTEPSNIETSIAGLKKKLKKLKMFQFQKKNYTMLKTI